MKLWVTEIRAIDPNDGELKTWAGPHVPGITWRFAEEYCQNHGLGYCKVIGELVAEIEYKSNDPWADLGERTDYDVGLN